MQGLQSVRLQCAFCGEPIEVLVDCSVPEQSYVEDCAVCCRPLVLDVVVDEDGVPSVAVRYENE